MGGGKQEPMRTEVETVLKMIYEMIERSHLRGIPLLTIGETFFGSALAVMEQAGASKERIVELVEVFYGRERRIPS